MPRLYLLGGENVHKRNASTVNELAFQDAGGHPAVVVFPWARASFDRLYSKRKLVSDYFLSLGAAAVEFIEYSDSKASMARKMASSNLIYLTGGLANALVERLKRKSVDELLSGYGGIIVGRSAGALALCRQCVITSRLNKKVSLIEGLGLADLVLKAHYRAEKDGVLQLLSMGQKVYGVPSRSAIIYDGGICSVIGEAFLFENGEKKTLDSAGNVSAKP